MRVDDILESFPGFCQLWLFSNITLVLAIYTYWEPCPRFLQSLNPK